MASVSVEDVHIHFPIYGSHRSLRKTLFERATGGVISREGRRDRVVIKALEGVSFQLVDGDRLGLIGHNGAGKSTLLKAIAGVYEPLSGRIVVEGNVTPLLNAMPGLDGEDTGYENVTTAGLLLGMTREEIERKIPGIEQFSELGEYMALPVRTYSSGMTTRLGFATATAVEPGILLMDEGIGAGDARFADRAKKRLDEFINRSQIVVLASHSDQMIRSVCNKAALMQNGQLLAFGQVGEVLEQYHAIVRGASAPQY